MTTTNTRGEPGNDDAPTIPQLRTSQLAARAAAPSIFKRHLRNSKSCVIFGGSPALAHAVTRRPCSSRFAQRTSELALKLQSLSRSFQVHPDLHNTGKLGNGWRAHPDCAWHHHSSSMALARPGRPRRVQRVAWPNRKSRRASLPNDPLSIGRSVWLRDRLRHPPGDCSKPKRRPNATDIQPCP